jgi:cell division protein FtsQ
MKQQKLLPPKKAKKVNIPLRRKFTIILLRLKFLLKFFLCIIISAFIFTNYLDSYQKKLSNLSFKFLGNYGFKLEHVIIEGLHHADESIILNSLNADIGTPIFAIDLPAIKANLEQNRWIKGIVIKRRLPSTIHFALFERKPLAIWQNAQKIYLIDDEGVVITYKNIEKFLGLPHVVGSDANIYAKKLIDDLSNYPEIQSKLISAVRLGERRWNLNLIQNITIKMPEDNEDNFGKALNYLDELNKAGKLFSNDIKSLDLRNLGKFYIEKY